MGVLILSNYIRSIKLWSDDMLDFYDSVLELRHDPDLNALDEWKENFDVFLKSLSNEERLGEIDAFAMASELSDRLEVLLQDATRKEKMERPVPIGGHTLPPLPYAYDALEPSIDRETMRLHHTKHHQSYVDGLNKAEKEMQKARNRNNFDLIKHWEKEAAFNGAGHYLHTIFWYVMSPDGGGEPTGELLQMIEQSFGSFDKFKRQFSEAANKVEGGGWAILVWSPRSGRLEILQAEKHQNLSQWDVIPLLVLDVWEHAYYLKYKNDRKKYIDNWWNVVNWQEVDARFTQALKLKWTAY